MNRSRSVSETSVGLFAFLDVLMSTMGSLILVLMVVTPKIRQEAVAKAAAAVRHAAEARRHLEAPTGTQGTTPPYVVPSVSQPARETVDLNAKLKVELAALSREAQERRRIAVANHEALSAAQTSLQKNQAELEELENRLERILQAKSRLAESVAKVSSEGLAVEDKLAKTKSRLRTLHGQIAHTSTIYTFVAYDGVTGTTRRPILIECTREHIKFLQENVSLSSTDVSGYSVSYNPVLAGAQALVDYWTTHSAPDEPRPYVLLVVRPSGAIAYAAARRLLGRMKDPFGYELLPDDQKLDIPPPVPEAAEACRKAVAKAISERVDVFKDVFGNGSGHGRRSRASQGGPPSPFDDLDNDSSGGSTRVGDNAAHGTGGESAAVNGSAAEPGGTGTASGGSVVQAETGTGPGTAQAGSLGDPGTAASASSLLKSGSPTPGSPGNGQAGALLSDTAPQAAGGLSGQLTGTSLPSVGTRGTDTSSGAPAASGAPNTAGDVASGAGGLGTGLSSNSAPQGDGKGAGFPNGGSPQPGKPGGDAAQGAFAHLEGATGSEGPGPAAGASTSQSGYPPSILSGPGVGGSPGQSNGSDRLTVGHPTPGVGAGDASEGQPTSQTGQAGGLESGSPGSGMQQDATSTGSASPGNGEAGGAASATAQSPASEFATPQAGSGGQPQSGQSGGMPTFGSPSTGASDGDEGSSSSGGDPPPNSKAIDGLPSFSASADDDGRPRRRGEPTAHRWGISSPRASIGYEHDVMLYIEAERIFVGGQPAILCGRGETSAQLSRAVLRALEREARNWGPPRENFYWVPSLKIVICAGGMLQYERIEPAFSRHGLNSTIDYRLELSRPAPLPRLVAE